MCEYMVSTHWIFSGKYKPVSVPNMLFPLAGTQHRTWVAKAKKEKETE